MNNNNPRHVSEILDNIVANLEKQKESVEALRKILAEDKKDRKKGRKQGLVGGAG